MGTEPNPQSEFQIVFYDNSDLNHELLPQTKIALFAKKVDPMPGNIDPRKFQAFLSPYLILSGMIIKDVLSADPRFTMVAPTEWGTGPITAVHDAGLLRFLDGAWQEYQSVVGDTREVVPEVFQMAGLRNKMSPYDEPSAIQGRLGYWSFEITTPLTEGTYEASRAAVDTAMTAMQFVLDGERGDGERDALVEAELFPDATELVAELGEGAVHDNVGRTQRVMKEEE